MPLPWIAVPLGETYLATVRTRPPSGSGTVFCTPARPKVCSPTIGPRPASSRAAATTSAAPAVPVSTSTASGRSQAEREGSALSTCSSVRAPESLPTDPPLRNSSATLTPSAGAPDPEPRRSRTSAVRAGAAQRVDLAADLVRRAADELRHLDVAGRRPRASAARAPRAARRSRTTDRSMGSLPARSRVSLTTEPGAPRSRRWPTGGGSGARVAAVDRLDDVARPDPRLVGGRARPRGAAPSGTRTGG